MKDQKTFDKRGPKDQDPTKIMGRKDQNSAKWGVGRKKMNNTKMAVTKIELAVKQGGQRGGGGWSNPQNICDIPCYIGFFPRDSFIINISICTSGPLQKWHVQMVIVIACYMFGGSAGRTLWDTRL